MQSFFLIFYFILEYSFLLKYNYLQCCVSGVLQKWFSYSLIYSFSDSFPIEVITDHWVWFSVLYSRSLFFFLFCFVFWTVLVFLAACGLSRVASGVCSLVVYRLLTAGASLVAEHGPWVHTLQKLAQQLRCTWHVGSSQIRARTHVPCIARRILNHWITREVQ